MIVALEVQIFKNDYLIFLNRMQRGIHLITDIILGISGELSPGDALPSMRFLAKELRISVITTKRAYSDLERDGFIETVTGKGSFVANQNLAFIREEQLRLAEEFLQKAVDIARSSDISWAELSELLELLYKGE